MFLAIVLLFFCLLFLLIDLIIISTFEVSHL